MELREKTDYATELARGTISWPGHVDEARIERLHVHADCGDDLAASDFEKTRLRLAWWRGKRILTRALTLPENDLIRLLAQALRQGALSPTFLAKLIVEAGKTESETT